MRFLSFRVRMFSCRLPLRYPPRLIGSTITHTKKGISAQEKAFLSTWQWYIHQSSVKRMKEKEKYNILQPLSPQRSDQLTVTAGACSFAASFCCCWGTACPALDTATPRACVLTASCLVFSITVWYTGSGGRVISITFFSKSILASAPMRVSRMRLTIHFSPSSGERLRRSERLLFKNKKASGMYNQ